MLNYWFSLGAYNVKHCGFSSALSAEPPRMEVKYKGGGRGETPHRSLPAFFVPVGIRADLHHVLSCTALPGGHLHKKSQNKCCYSTLKHVILSSSLKKARGSMMQTPAVPC